MSYISVFRRYELKYLLTREQKQVVLEHIAPYMELDRYGRTTICNVYYDTASYRLIRRSIEKPAYKEKLRIRSYGRASADSTVFVELKKKYDGVVYKRRIAMTEPDAFSWLCNRSSSPSDSQIVREIEYFMDYYQDLRPTMFLSYEREAYYQNDGGDFRITFDDNILCRSNDLSLDSEPYGCTILPQDMVLMELKCSGAIPLWMVDVLSRNKIYKTSFSKYGTAYAKTVLPTQMITNSKEQYINA